ncbi:hypothetical protein OUZ56_001670 [Daphnia magna]|uniref:Secreted protein n=1 Tax=Daphnia magna TaxID=35525 RepID=A0ABR0A3C4_9CRUS|nr:hypothetical protein OUZ56_001670 [Daphnia magna]
MAPIYTPMLFFSCLVEMCGLLSFLAAPPKSVALDIELSPKSQKQLAKRSGSSCWHSVSIFIDTRVCVYNRQKGKGRNENEEDTDES